MHAGLILGAVPMPERLEDAIAAVIRTLIFDKRVPGDFRSDDPGCEPGLKIRIHDEVDGAGVDRQQRADQQACASNEAAEVRFATSRT